MIIIILFLVFATMYISAPTEKIKDYKIKRNFQIRNEIAIIIDDNTNMELLNEAIKYFDVDFRIIDWKENIMSNIYQSGYRVVIIDIDKNIPIDLVDEMIIINSRNKLLNCYNIQKHHTDIYTLWDSIILAYECLKYIDGKMDKNYIMNLATRYTFGYSGMIKFDEEGNRIYDM